MDEWYTPCHAIPQFEYTHDMNGTKKLVHSVVKQEELKYLKNIEISITDRGSSAGIDEPKMVEIEGKKPEQEGAQNQNNGGGNVVTNPIITQGLQQASQPTQAQNMVNAINGGGGQSFDHMYGGPSNPLQNAQMPMGDGLMAANEVLGGSFGTAF